MSEVSRATADEADAQVMCARLVAVARACVARQLTSRELRTLSAAWAERAVQVAASFEPGTPRALELEREQRRLDRAELERRLWAVCVEL